METRAEDAGLTRRPMLASSWDAARGVLAHSLRLTRADLGARDLDWEEPLTPPAAGHDLVVLKSGPSSPGEKPCFLHLSCEPGGAEEIVSVGLLSSARNMEVYLGEEYCGTSRGEAVCGDPAGRSKIIFYKKYLQLESSSRACKIKLLSFGEEQRVFIGKIVVQLRRVSANSSTSSPALGSRIDLQRVQTLMEAMGSKLSPGAQQLMNMVKFQQQNCVPVGEQLQAVLGNTGYRRVADLQSSAASGASDKSPSTPFPFRTGLTSGTLTEDLNACVDKSPQPPGGGNTTHLRDYHVVPPNHSLLENDLRNAVSSLLPKKASDASNIPNSELLPFLQNLCSQVNHLRVGHSARWQEGITKAGEGVVGVATEEQPVCSYLEKILTKNMELLEKKLVDSIDQQIRRLQEHVDRKMAVLMDLLQNPPSPPPGTALTQCDSGERLSNGER
ncbi:ATPase PAAT-like isoform X2 [Lontra canadensis]|uniref:ATPase PAAT-like isoform X2 n=1 Tax=Lontra canadensis TaxID=76717 RepID=UPI0013F3985B|nr:ATPase PAAT-like isoform X2 [Lontra canadensis]